MYYDFRDITIAKVVARQLLLPLYYFYYNCKTNMF